MYYDPLTSLIQLRWFLDSYSRARELLKTTFQISQLDATTYLLGNEMYKEVSGEVFREAHPEWTQGFASGSEMYINRAPVRVWDEYATREQRIRWAGENVQEVTERITAHELTHVGLNTLDVHTRWIDEGMAEYIESLIAPPESAAKQMLQRRYLVRDAIAKGVVPTESQLRGGDWIYVVNTQEEFRLLYAVSALIVQQVADRSGDEGLRSLIEAEALDTSLGEFIDTELRSWLLIALPQELAAPVVCGLNRVRGTKTQITSDWNANTNKTSKDYSDFKVRVQQLLDSAQNLPANTIVEEVRQTYINRYSKWITAIDYYLRGDGSEANHHLTQSNLLGRQAFDLFVATWDKYVAAPCELIEEQLKELTNDTTSP